MSTVKQIGISLKALAGSIKDFVFNNLAILCMLILLVFCILDFPHLKHSVFGAMTLKTRFLVLAISLSLFFVGRFLITRFLLTLKRYGLPNISKKNTFSWLYPKLFPVIASLLIFGLLLMLRPRIHWGDSDVVYFILKLNAPYLDRWLSSIQLLNHIYQFLSNYFFSNLLPNQFLTFFYAFLGVLEIWLIRSTIRIVFPKDKYDKLRTYLYLFIYSSFAVFILTAGYFEIYFLVNFGLVLYFFALAGLLKISNNFYSFFFGLITGFIALLYIGLMPLLVISSFVFLFYVGKNLGRRKVADILCQAILFFLGIMLGFYLNEWIIEGKIPLDPRDVLYFVYDKILLFNRVRSTDAYFLPWGELFSYNHFSQFIATFLIYDIFGLSLFAFCLFQGLRRAMFRRRLHFHFDGFFVALMTISLMYLYSMYTKAFVMGFRDWDLFVYIVYPINLFAVYSFFVVLKEQLSKTFLFFLYAKVVWFLLIFLIMNPLSPKLNVLPKKMLVEPLYNYDFGRHIPMSKYFTQVEEYYFVKRQEIRSMDNSSRIPWQEMKSQIEILYPIEEEYTIRTLNRNDSGLESVLYLTLKVKNVSDLPWHCGGKWPIKIGVLWYRDDDTNKIVSEQCNPMWKDIQPGESLNINAKVGPQAAGNWVVWIGLVQYGNAWFWHVNPGNLIKIKVKVLE